MRPRTRSFLFVTFFAASLAACNSILGIESPEPADNGQADGSTDATVGGDVQADAPKGDAASRDVATSTDAADAASDTGGGNLCGDACAAGQHCDAHGQCVCDSTSCATGCCSGNTCVSPTSVTECGTGGAACSTCNTTSSDSCDTSGKCACGTTGPCAADQQCVGGKCQCNASTCTTGCCDSTGHCAKSSQMACGVGGAACKQCDTTTSNGCDANGNCACGNTGACATGQACTNGTCTCGGGTCNGCCGTGNTCVTPTFPQCGAGGASCQTCSTTTADRCDATGNCSCGGAAPCAAGQRCSGGQCICDSNSCGGGCCSGTTCKTPSLGACGSNGQACKACDPNTADRCDANGNCSCGGGAFCGSGQQCVGGSCQCTSSSCPNGCCSGVTCIAQPNTNACGVGGASCGNCAVQIQHATGATCTTGGGCDYSSCLPGFVDMDGARSNGCETTLPTGIPEASSLVLWLRADSGWNGSTWFDSSGGGRNATTDYGTMGTSTLNGKTVLDFASGGQLRIGAGFPAWNGATAIMLTNTTTENGGVLTMGMSYNPSCNTTPPNGAPNCVPYDMLGWGPTMSFYLCDPNLGSCYHGYSPGVPTGQWIRSMGIENPSANTYHSYFNGGDNGALGPGPFINPWNTPRQDTLLNWYYSSGAHYMGLVAEIIVYNVAISDSSRVALDAYLQRKWGL